MTGESRRLLVVDDDPAVSEFVRKVAEQANFEATAITEPAQFREAYRVVPDVIVLDLLMPGTDGVEIIRYLADMDCRARLVLISGLDIAVLHAAQQLAFERGLNVVATLAKPFQVAELDTLLRNIPAGFQPPSIESRQQLTRWELQRAISNGELQVHYQPQLELRGRGLAGVEALVRWQHPEQGLLAPGMFIPLAEEAGLMEAMTQLVLEDALQQCHRWSAKGCALHVAVNISASAFTRLRLPEEIESLVSRHGLAAEQLTLEITEHVLIEELIDSLDILTRMRMKGIELSIDDFGTGFSSMHQLHRVPFTEMKIDRSFVARAEHDAEARAIVETSIVLAHKLGMKAVGEGVETRAVWDLLERLGCDQAQGYFIAPPMPAADLLPWYWQACTPA